MAARLTSRPRRDTPVKLVRYGIWALFLLSVGCPAPKTEVAVSITPLSGTVSAGGTLQFAASVSGASDATVDWSVKEGATGGTVSDSGLYTAPGAAGSFTVVATSRADSTRSASASVTVTAPQGISVSVSPTATTVEVGQQVTFTATVTGTTNTAVTWSLQEANAGTISAAGVYTAPATAGVFTVIATALADPTRTATATVTVTDLPTVTVTLSPSSAALGLGAEQTFTATVSGTTNTAVTWSVQETGGGTVSNGTYTAPSTAGTFHVVATSVADPSKSGLATVTVSAVQVVAVSISPQTVTVSTGGQQSFTATVTGTSNTAVTWSVQESAGGTVSAGTYTAPATAGTYHLVATSVADPSKGATATITVSATPVVSVSISPTSASVLVGATQGFTATVSGNSNLAVTWSVQEAAGGMVSAGTYTAPATPGTYHVVATSVADPSKSATATVTVNANPAISVSISPVSASLLVGAVQTFTATVTGSSNTAVTWAVQESAGGVVNAGTYTAPSTAGTFHVVATSAADTSKSATATVTVSTPVVVVTLSPAAAALQVGQSRSFTATVTGSSNTAVTWSVQESAGGTVLSDGTYTAPNAAGTFHVVATSVADASKSATATITVSSPVAVSISPSTVTVTVGALQSFTATVTGTTNTAVTWSVQESGGGTVSAGTYTAPAAAGTFHVVATSVADTSRSATATVTVSSSPVVSVALSPTAASLVVNGTQSFTATVSGSGNTAVTWSVSGGGSIAPSGNTALYTAPAAAGSYQVIATSVADNTRSASASVTVALPAGPTVSGTVVYAGSKTGRIYLTLDNSGGQGTSLTTPGAFAIRGVQNTGTMRVKAFMDVLGIGAFNYAADPVGEAIVNLTGGDLTGVTVTLTEAPAATTPGQAGQPFVIPAADSLIVGSSQLTDAQGRELATAYRLYWSTTPNPGPTNRAAGAPKIIPAGGVGAVFLGSPAVSAGGTYYFSLSAVNGTLEGPLSAQSGPVTVANASAGTTVSGQVSFPGLTVSGPLFVGLFNKSGGAYFTRITGTTSPQSFTIPGVQPGSYEVFSALDANNDGIIGLGDPMYGFGSRGAQRTVGSTPMTGLDFTLSAGDSNNSLQTRHERNGAGPDHYQLLLRFSPNLKRPVKAVIISGPNVNVPVDVGLNMNNNGGGSAGEHGLSWSLGTIAPIAGQTYLCDLTYQDGSTATVSLAVTGVVAAPPTALTPTGTGVAVTPTLTWSLPGSLPSPYSLHVWVGGNSNGWDYSLGAGATSVPYNVDGSAGSLVAGGTYSWSIEVVDQDGNQASDSQQFTVADVSISLSPTTATLVVGAGQTFVATVTGATNTAVNWSVQEAGGGSVTAGGDYTAPGTPGTYHVVATSQADPSRSATATVTVNAAPVVSVSLSPPSASVLVGQTQSFTATVTGTANTAVTWTVSGSGSIAPSGNTAVYTAPSTAGTYQVIATSVGDPSKSASATVTVSLAPLPSVSGTISYPGIKTGRIYLALQNGGGMGTSLTAPGAFTIRGVQGGGTVTLKVFMDVLGTGAFNVVADPAGEATFALTGADLTGIGVTLSDPPLPSTPAQAGAPFVIPAADSLMVGLSALRDTQGREVATGYNVYWSTTPNPGPGNKAAGAPRAVPAGGVGLVYLGSPTVAAGQSYYFSVSALNGTLEGPVSAQSGPVTVAAQTGGTTVSGQVSFPGVTVTGPFVVGIYSKSGGAAYTRVTGTTSPQAFTIPGVPPGSYQVFSFIDANNEGVLGLGDPSIGFTDNTAEVVVAGTPVTGLGVTLPGDDSVAAVTTRHSRGGASTDNYQLELSVNAGVKRPVKVVLASGPNVNVPVDVGLNINSGGGSAGGHRVSWQLGTVLPVVGQSYRFDVTYQDGSTGKLERSRHGHRRRAAHGCFSLGRRRGNHSHPDVDSARLAPGPLFTPPLGGQQRRRVGLLPCEWTDLRAVQRRRPRRAAPRREARTAGASTCGTRMGTAPATG